MFLLERRPSMQAGSVVLVVAVAHKGMTIMTYRHTEHVHVMSVPFCPAYLSSVTADCLE